MHQVAKEVLQAMMPEEDPVSLWNAHRPMNCQLYHVHKVALSQCEVVRVDVATFEVREPGLDRTSSLKREILRD